MIQRIDNWPALLFVLLDERRNMPFAWGKQDCAMFACAAVEAMTGENLAAKFPAYDSREGAQAIIEAQGGLDKLPAAAGLAELACVRKAQRGDVVLFGNDGDPALGVCVGQDCAFTGKDGIVFHPLRECSRAWRVG